MELSSGMPLAQRDHDFHVNLGLVHQAWADYQDGAGDDSTEHRSAAIDAYSKAISMNEQAVAVWLNLGINYFARASRPDDRDAEGDLARAASRSPPHSR
ncbi:MAG: hypothetical protein R3B70_43065 [Polyangiaceae bacterium]